MPIEDRSYQYVRLRYMSKNFASRDNRKTLFFKKSQYVNPVDHSILVFHKKLRNLTKELVQERKRKKR